jgi:hypothetical protein
MSTQDTFNGAKSGLTFMRAYVNTVAQKIGVEEALAIDSKVSESLGAVQGKMIKQQIGTKEVDVKEASQILLNVIEKGYGISSEVIDESPNKIACKIGKCPVFESGQELGMDVKDIETNCRSSAICFMDSIAKQINPNLSYQLTKFRSSADDCCEEAIVLS